MNFLQPGRTLKHYRMINKIGQGGMGEVYLAEDTKLDRKVALKILPAELASDQQRMRRFVQEAKAASALNHPNILTIFEVGEADSVSFIATEFIDGETLRQHMNMKHMKIAEALDIGVQIASALSAAHAAGIIHRDIKPENVMVRRDHIVKVLDFGLAKLSERTDTRAVDTEAATKALVQTEPGVVMGTAAYMSPEQARGLLVDARTDIFSLGVVIYEMVAGQAPFSGTTRSDLIVALLERDPPPLARFSSEAPPELERLVMKTLAKDREERYQTAKDLAIDLRKLKQRLEFEAELERSAQPHASQGTITKSGAQGATEAVAAATHPITSAEYLVTEAKRHKLGVFIALAAVLALAVGLVYFLRGGSNKGKPIDSLAVLPFVNVNADPSTEYLSDGITDSLINSLSKLPNLKVMSRNSVFRYKGKETDALDAAHALGVRAVLTGKLIEQGDNLSISVELVDALDNSHLWGEQYNRKVSNLLAVQEEIAREVSEKLRLRLSGEEQNRATKRYTDNAEAYQLYLKGRFFWNKFTPADHLLAAEYFNQAIAKDPTFALAYVGLADTYGASATNSWISPVEGYQKAKAAVKKALEIDDTLAEAHATLGALTMFYDLDWAAAEREYKRAFELNSNYILTYELYSYLLLAIGRLDEGIDMAKRGLELDPLSALLNDDTSQAYYLARRYDEAVKQYQKSIEMDPNRPGAYTGLGPVYEQKGMYDQAIAAYQKAINGSERTSNILGLLGHAYAASGRRGEALKILDEISKQKQKYVSPYDLAILYTGLGEKDQAIEQLNKAYQERAGFVIYLRVEPLFDPLRSDPRFADLLRRFGFPQ